MYLNPKDPSFPQPSGTVSMRSRWVRHGDGSVESKPWIFNEVGVDTAFDALKIRGDPDEDDPHNAELEDDKFLAALKSARLIETEEKMHQGMIEVVLHRVRVGSKWDDKKFEAKLTPADEKMKLDSSHSLSHTVGYVSSLPYPRITTLIPRKAGKGT